MVLCLCSEASGREGNYLQCSTALSGFVQVVAGGPMDDTGHGERPPKNLKGSETWNGLE